MGLLIPTFADPLSLALEAREREIEEKQVLYIAQKTRQSERGDNPPETIDSTELLSTSMNWDFSPGWEDRRIRYVKSLRERGIPFRPSVRVRMPDGFVQNVYEGDHVDLRWFEQGDCCVRCCHWKATDPLKHQRDHETLQGKTGATPPEGVPLKDLCGFCGNNLANQKYRTKAA